MPKFPIDLLDCAAEDMPHFAGDNQPAGVVELAHALGTTRQYAHEIVDRGRIRSWVLGVGAGGRTFVLASDDIAEFVQRREARRAAKASA